MPGIILLLCLIELVEEKAAKESVLVSSVETTILTYLNISAKTNDLRSLPIHSTKQRTPVISDILSSTEYKRFYFFNHHFFYFTTIPGLITNPLTIYLSSIIRPFGTFELHMCVLGTTDLAVVVNRLVFNILNVTEFYWTDLLCKLIYFVTNLSYMFSNWILVSWAFERWFAVNWPFKVGIFCSTRNVSIVLTLCFVLCFCLAIPNITETNVKPSDGQRYACSFSEFYFTKYAMVDNLFYMYLPMIFVGMVNISIISKLLLNSKTSFRLTTNKETLSRRSKETAQTTTILVTITVVFIVVHLPQLLVKIFEALYPNPVKTFGYDYRVLIKYHIFRVLGYQITDFQNSINFVLYCVFGSKVQKAMENVCFWCNKESFPASRFYITSKNWFLFRMRQVKY